ncbi:MAG: hypothetical protein HRU75_05500 [Planctomycetia bacterium]|nr:MAG: hypothetical protein HRU75_05500 [Planctomycetia bacterium]
MFLLSLSSTAGIVAVCAAAVALTLLLWHRTRPPMLASVTLPPVMRRGVAWWLILSSIAAAAALAWVLLRGPLDLPRRGVFRYVPLALGLVPLLIINPVYLWRTAWIRRAAALADGRLCTHCAYNVTGLPDAGRCPECGNAYDVAADAVLWQAIALRPKDRAAAIVTGVADRRDNGPSDRSH